MLARCASAYRREPMVMPSGRGVYALFDLTLEINWQNKKTQSELDFFLSLFPLSKRSTWTEKPDIRLNMVYSNDSKPTFVAPSGSKKAYGLSIINNDEVCHISDGDSLFSTYFPMETSQINLHQSIKEKSLLSKSNFFLLGMFQLLLRRGFFDLHAAGLIHDGVGFLLIGESGSGKSTTALNLVGNGWHYLSDDALLLRRHPKGIQALGFRKQFYLDLNTTQRWPLITNKLQGLNCAENEKTFVDLEQIYPGSLQESVLPRVLIFNRIISRAKTVIRPLDQTRALTRLINQSASLSFNRQTVQQHLDVLRDLVKQSRSYELLAGRDIIDDPGKASEILLSIAPTPKTPEIYHQPANKSTL